jgi:hypothetical protein
VKLYAEVRHFGLVHAHPAYGSGKQPPEERARLISEFEKLADLTGLEYGYEEIVPSNNPN